MSALVPMGNFPQQLRPYQNITPFTYRDGLTYLEVLESLRHWLRYQLVPFIDNEVKEITDSFTSEVNRLIVHVDAALLAQAEHVDAALALQLLNVTNQLTTQNTNITNQLATQNTNITNQLATQNTAIALSITNLTAFVNTSVSDARDYVDDAVESIINSTISVTDPVMIGVFNNITTAFRIKLNQTYVGKGSLVTNPMDYGAVGDGVTDDTAAVQAALNAVAVNGEVKFPKLFKVSVVTLNKYRITLSGPGGITDGKLVLGSTGATADQYTNIKGMTFTHSDASRVGGSMGIEILKIRRVTITDCDFSNLDKGVAHRAFADATAHVTAMIKIVKNEFANVNYAWYVDCANPATLWQHNSDSKFIANTVNVAYITHVYVKAIDGLICNDNVFFFPSYNTNDAAAKANKMNNIYVGQSDWLIIKGNNCFEAGESAILISQGKHGTISDNMIAWPGQRVASAGITMIGSNQPYFNIHDNVIGRISGNGIDILSTGSGVMVVKNNVIEFDVNSIYYYGTPALSTFAHYGVNHAETSTDNCVESGNVNSGDMRNSRKGSTVSAIRVDQTSGVASGKAGPISVTAANTPVFSLVGTGYSSVGFAGLLLIEARNTDTGSANSAAYAFHATKTPGGVVITQLSAQGLITGGSSSHPSFTFTLDSTGKLLATPIGATSGTYFFYASALGNLRVIAA